MIHHESKASSSCCLFAELGDVLQHNCIIDDFELIDHIQNCCTFNIGEVEFQKSRVLQNRLQPEWPCVFSRILHLGKGTNNRMKKSGLLLKSGVGNYPSVDNFCVIVDWSKQAEPSL